MVSWFCFQVMDVFKVARCFCKRKSRGRESSRVILVQGVSVAVCLVLFFQYWVPGCVRSELVICKQKRSAERQRESCHVGSKCKCGCF